MNKIERPPRVFISYSWTTPEHETWVIAMAERLMSDGIEVIIDKWDLKEGHDKYHFMENMVKSDQIQKVILILDKLYSEKAELRKGGVGTETQIITPEVYGNVSQEKFIPIVTEKDEDGSPYVPTYLKGRIYIDFSELEQFEENYDKLLRNIYRRPAQVKPKLGAAPSYLFEDSPNTYRTSHLLRSVDIQIGKAPHRINSIIREFLNSFFDDLASFRIDFSSITKDIFSYGKAIHNNIISYTPLRNGYITFLDKLLKSELQFDTDMFIRFFEGLPSLKKALDDKVSSYDNEFDNFKFAIHEIFLYTITAALKNESYWFLTDIFYTKYFFREKYNNSKPLPFQHLYNHVSIFDSFYRETFSQNFISPMADLIVKRIPEGIRREQLIEADLLCHYITVLEECGDFAWFPMTYIYRDEGRSDLDLLKRLISRKHFEKVKLLLNVETIEELREKINRIEAIRKDTQPLRYSNSFHSIAPIYQLIRAEKIGTER